MAKRDSELQFQTLFESGSDAVLLMKGDRFLECNAKALQAFGCTREQITHHSLHEFSPHFQADGRVSREKVLEKVHAAMHGEPQCFEWKLARLDGTPLDVEVSLDPIEFGGADLLRMVFRDITARKEAEKSVHEKELRFKTLFESAHDAIFLMSGERFIECNPKTLEMFDCTRDQILGRMPYANEFSPPFQPDGRDSKEKALDMIHAALEGKPQAFEWTHTRYRDAPFTAEITLNQIEIGDKKLLQAIVRDITERKEAEMTLRESEARFRLLSDLTFDGVFIHQDGVFQEANDVYLRMLGYASLEELRGSGVRILDTVVPLNQAEVQQKVGARFEGTYQIHLRRKDGSEFPAEIVVKNILYRGRPARGAYVRDVTGWLTAQAALRESEERYRTLVQSMGEGLGYMDPEGIIRFANPAAESIFGVSAGTLVGQNLKEFLDSGWPETLKARIKKQKEDERNSFELRIRRPDGEHRDLLITAKTHQDSEGTLLGIRSVFRDITEWKEAEGKLKRLSTAIEQGYDSIIITDTAGAILYANPSTESLTGFAGAELAGRNVRLFRGRQQDSTFYRRLWETLIQGEVWSGRLVNERSDGTPFQTDTTFSPVRDEDGRIVYIVISSRDVTREKELEVQLLHAQRMEAIGVLAGGLAHDFNNILMPMMGYTEMVLAMVEENAKASEYLQRIHSAAKRAAELVQQILTFSRHSEQVTKPVRFYPILKEAMNLLRAAIPTTVTFQQQIEEKEAWVLGDSSQLHQVIMNLCTNAYHAMGEKGGVLGVALDLVPFDQPQTIQGNSLQEGDYLRLQISDTGHGMSDETQRKIFLPFFTTKNVGAGTGLGLSIVHGIVVGMGGGITVKSKVGEGSTFTLFLPVARAEAREPAAPPAPISIGQERILVVDDDVSIVELLQDALSKFGYQVTSVASSTKGLVMLKANPEAYDLVITDLTMPELTGLDLAEAMHELRPGLPILLITGNGGDLDEASLQAKGIFAKIGKPVSLADLADHLRDALDKRIEGPRATEETGQCPDPRRPFDTGSPCSQGIIPPGSPCG